jgi:hypothetical protein
MTLSLGFREGPLDAVPPVTDTFVGLVHPGSTLSNTPIYGISAFVAVTGIVNEGVASLLNTLFIREPYLPDTRKPGFSIHKAS